MLNTTISAPHEAQITDMCFCQAADSQTTMLVSASKEGHFKAWQLEPGHTEGKSTLVHEHFNWSVSLDFCASLLNMNLYRSVVVDLMLTVSLDLFSNITGKHRFL